MLRGKASRGGETELEKLTAQIYYIAEGQGTFTIKLQQKNHNLNTTISEYTKQNSCLGWHNEYNS